MARLTHEPIEIGEVRRRLRLEIERLRREAAAHRAQVAEASSAFDRVLEDVAVPLFRQFGNALRAEGFLFRLLTPSGTVRLEAERSDQNFLELALDTGRRPVAVLLRRGYTRGGHVFEDERVLVEGSDLDGLTPAMLLDALLADAVVFLQR